MMSSILLSDIENVSRSELSESRLHNLENGYDSFDKVLNSNSDPITLERNSFPYKIIDGRHRIYLAREKGRLSVNANLV